MAYGAILGQTPKIPETYSVGDIKVTTRTDLGENWLLCNGDTVDAGEYSALAKVIAPAVNITLDNELWEESNPDVTPYYWGGKYFRFCSTMGTNRITYSDTINGVYTAFNFGFSRQFSVRKIKEYQGKLCILLFTPTDYDAPDVCNLLILNSDLTYRLIALNFDGIGRTPQGPIDFAFGTTQFVLIDSYVSGYKLRFYYSAMPNLSTSTTVSMNYANINESYAWYYKSVFYNANTQKFQILVYTDGTTRFLVVEETSLTGNNPTCKGTTALYQSSYYVQVTENSFAIEIDDYIVIFGYSKTAVFSKDSINDSVNTSSSVIAISYMDDSVSSQNYVPSNVCGVMVMDGQNGVEVYTTTGDQNSMYVRKYTVSNEGIVTKDDIFKAGKTEFEASQIWPTNSIGLFKLNEYYAFCIMKKGTDASAVSKYQWYYGYVDSISLPTISIDGAYAYIKAKE